MVTTSSLEAGINDASFDDDDDECHDRYSDGEAEDQSTATVVKIVASHYLPKKESSGESTPKEPKRDASPTRADYDALVLERKEQLQSPPTVRTNDDKKSRHSKFSSRVRRSDTRSSRTESMPGAVAAGDDLEGGTAESTGEIHNSQPLMAIRVDPGEVEQQITSRIHQELKSQLRTQVEEEIRQQGVLEAVAFGNQEDTKDKKASEDFKLCGVMMSRKFLYGVIFLAVVFAAVGVALAIVFATRGSGSSTPSGSRNSDPTDAPTSPPILSTGQRLDQLIQIYTTTYPGESTAVFDDQASNQFMAMNYLASNDPARLDLDTTDPIVLMERYIAILFLLQLHFIDLDENGNVQGSSQIGIVSSDPVCSWNLLGVSGVFCDDGERMSDVILFRAGLFGMLPTEIGFLTNLKQMELRDNSLTGILPSEVGFMTSLEHFSVFKSSLIGNVPSEVGELTLLTSLNLGENSFVGTIPTELGECTNLERLYLQDLRNLEGPVPTQLSSLIHLEDLRLEYTPVTGNFTDLFCHPPTSIGDLRANCFDGIECGCCTHCCGATMECITVP